MKHRVRPKYTVENLPCKFLNKKAAIELSVNFLVILIISLVVFGSGLTLFWKIYQSGEEQLRQVSRNVEQKIITQLHGGAKVSVVPRSIDLDRDEEYIIGIGINNVLPEDHVFKIFARRGLFVREDMEPCTFSPGPLDTNCATLDPPIPLLKLLGDNVELRVESNKQEISNLMIKTERKALSGRYTIDVCVCYNELTCIDYESCKLDSYDINYPVSKIRVNVH
ncbi:MAG: hypothetical protein U9R34_03175 [Nanoarchaeota archaeon]|nr:hypothetical protein [Nanoarchaeota archaeon]